MSEIRIGINGFGRIGRMVFRAAFENSTIKVVGINDVIDGDYLAYLLSYDSTYGRFQGKATFREGMLNISGNSIRVTSERNPSDINWKEVRAEYVVESSGNFLDKIKCQAHLDSGARKVIISAPSKDDTPMFVMGINHNNYHSDMNVVSNASCSSNCLAVIAKVLNDQFGLKEALLTTVHPATATQKTVDGMSKKNSREGRGSLQNIIPTSTGAAKALNRIIPEIKGKITGISFRVPNSIVSVADLTCRFENPAPYALICEAMKAAAEGELKGILGYTEDDVVSTDFISDSRLAVFDAGAGFGLNDHFAKVVAWFDNEWAYSKKLIDLIVYMRSVDRR